MAEEGELVLYPIEGITLIYEASKFVFAPPPQVSRARRVLIKPCASYPLPYPVSTSREILQIIVDGIRRVSDADVLILEGTPGGGSVYPIYKALNYDFPRVLMLDVKDCIWVEVENPLLHPFAVPTFWVPNVVLSSDYLISVTPFKVLASGGSFSIRNLLGLLPASKYRGEETAGWGVLRSLGLEKVIADLYFTLPFDMGIVEAPQKLICEDDSIEGRIEEYGKTFLGEPFEVDSEASAAAGVSTEYLSLIEAGRAELG